MSHAELITIGVFARSSGLTPSALRFYADSGLLQPAEVDAASGYRYYTRDQLDRAVTIRRLREIDMPLEKIVEVLDAGPEEAAVLIDRHVDALAEQVHRARRTAAEVRGGLGRTGGPLPVATVPGPVLATAVEQVLAATAHEPDHPVLGGVRLEASAACLVLTATDRYRLSTRTVALDPPCRMDWAGTLDGDDLRLALPWTRRRTVVELAADRHGLHLRADGDTRHCRLLADPFPDHRAMLDALAPVVTRAVVPRNVLVHALERQRGRRVLLRVSGSAVAVSTPDAAGSPVVVAAGVHGPDAEITFEITTLHPAVTTAVGPDLMLDIAAADQPVLVRSADDGDLTTVAMPVRPTPDEGDDT
ncbi:DNA polymerase III subunit beta family protein [Rhodococcus sp. NPDC003322]